MSRPFPEVQGPKSKVVLSLFLATTACVGKLNLAADPWLELKSENFTLRTDRSEEDARVTITALEQTRSVYLRALAWGGGRPSRHQPFNVIEVADETELHEFSKKELLGFVTGGSRGELVVMSGEESPDAQPVLKHELAHAVAGQMLRTQSPWFAEGLACFLENTHRELGGGERDIIGDIDLNRVAWIAQHTLMPASQILAEPGAIGLEDREGARFESSAYEMFFMLFNRRPAELAAYMRKLARGDDPTSAFAATFPDLTPDKLDEMILDSQRNGAHYSKLAVTILPYQGPLAVRTMSPAEVHTQLGILFALSPGVADRAHAMQRARAEFSQALVSDPGDPEAAEGLLALNGAKPAEWLEAARRAVALHPDSWQAQLFLLAALRRSPPEPVPGTAGSPPPDEMLLAGKTAAALAPDEPAALIAYANLLSQRHNTAEGLPVAERAVAVAPDSANARAALALQQRLAKQFPEALASLQRAMELTSERAPRKFVDFLISMQQEIEKEMAESYRAKAAADAAAQAIAAGKPPPPDPALTVVASQPHEHDARVPIDRAPKRISCPTQGPALRHLSADPGKLTAEVRYVIGDDGKLKKVDAISGSNELVAAIRAWLSTCTFEPGRRGGAPVDAEVREVFSFGAK